MSRVLIFLTLLACTPGTYGTFSELSAERPVEPSCIRTGLESTPGVSSVEALARTSHGRTLSWTPIETRSTLFVFAFDGTEQSLHLLNEDTGGRSAGARLSASVVGSWEGEDRCPTPAAAAAFDRMAEAVLPRIADACFGGRMPTFETSKRCL